MTFYSDARFGGTEWGGKGGRPSLARGWPLLSLYGSTAGWRVNWYSGNGHRLCAGGNHEWYERAEGLWYGYRVEVCGTCHALRGTKP